MGDYDGASGNFENTPLGKIIPELTTGVVYNGIKEIQAQLFAKEIKEAEVSDEDDELDSTSLAGIMDPPPKVKHFKRRKDLQDIRGGTVLKRVIKKGLGEIPKGAKVFYVYAAFLENKKKPFDTSTQHQKMSSSISGEKGEILGFTYALESMLVGEVAQFWIDYKYAFGQTGCPPRIPPKANILVNIQINDIYDPEMMNTVPYMDPEKRKLLPFEEIFKSGMKLKQLGNDSITQNDFQKAVRYYRKALQLVENHWNVSEDQEKDRSEFREVCYTNMAQAYIKLNKAPQACNACKDALNSGSDLKIAKTYYRFAKAKMILQDYDRALEYIKKGAKYFDGGEESVTYKQYEKEINDLKHADKMIEMNMCKKMFGRTKGKKDKTQRATKAMEKLSTDKCDSPC